MTTNGTFPLFRLLFLLLLLRVNCFHLKHRFLLLLFLLKTCFFFAQIWEMNV